MRKQIYVLSTILCVMFLSISSVQASGKAPGNETLFIDNFDNGPDPEWKPAFGNWTMQNGMYTISGIEDNMNYLALLGYKKWSDFILTVDIKPGHTGRYINEVVIFPRVNQAGDGIGFWIDSKYGSFSEAGWSIRQAGTWMAPLAVAKLDTVTGETAQIRIEVKGNIFTAYLNDVQILEILDNTFSSGLIGIGQWYEHWFYQNDRAGFDNFCVGLPSLVKKAVSPIKGMGPEPTATQGAVDKETLKKTERAAMRAEKAALDAKEAAAAAKKAAMKAQGLSKKQEEMLKAK